MKRSRILVVLLSSVNHRFSSYAGCSGWNATSFGSYSVLGLHVKKWFHFCFKWFLLWVLIPIFQWASWPFHMGVPTPPPPGHGMHKCFSALHALQDHMVLDNILVSVDYRITLSPCKLILILCAHRTASCAYNNCFTWY